MKRLIICYLVLISCFALLGCGKSGNIDFTNLIRPISWSQTSGEYCFEKAKVNNLGDCTVYEIPDSSLQGYKGTLIYRFDSADYLEFIKFRFDKSSDFHAYMMDFIYKYGDGIKGHWYGAVNGEGAVFVSDDYSNMLEIDKDESVSVSENLKKKTNVIAKTENDEKKDGAFDSERKKYMDEDVFFYLSEDERKEAIAIFSEDGIDFEEATIIADYEHRYREAWVGLCYDYDNKSTDFTELSKDYKEEKEKYTFVFEGKYKWKERSTLLSGENVFSQTVEIDKMSGYASESYNEHKMK